MTKALWLTVAQCCGEKENKEKGVGWCVEKDERWSIGFAALCW